MRTYLYLRVSTNKQSFEQQLNSIESFLLSKGMQADEIYTDEGISGGTSYKERSLNELIEEMKPNDCLVVSEISRLGRSMSDLNKLVNDELKPRKLRLIIVSMGLDLDCSKLKAIDEMILFAFSFSAQIEKEMIQERTKSALEARQKQIEEKGYFISKAGIKRERLGCPDSDIKKAAEKSAKVRRERSINNEHNIRFAQFIEDWVQIHGEIDKSTDWQSLVSKLNKRGLKTSSGLEFDERRARAMMSNLKRMNQITV